MPLTIAIDGPAGAGKSTVARRVASALHLTYIDTGAMYRAVAWKALQTGADPNDVDGLTRLAQNLNVRFSSLTPDMQQQVYLEEEDVTTAIRAPQVSNLTSAISAFPSVRQVIDAQQRRMGQADAHGVILEGRDIGTVVFPDAQLKIFLTASPEERARRRVAELTAQGMDVDFNQILADQHTRDARDSRRAASPLVAAADAILLDTDTLSIEQVVTRILERVASC